MTGVLTFMEVCERLRLSDPVVRSLLRSGKLPAQQIGVGKRGQWRVLETELESFLRRGKGESSGGNQGESTPMAAA